MSDLEALAAILEAMGRSLVDNSGQFNIAITETGVSAQVTVGEGAHVEEASAFKVGPLMTGGTFTGDMTGVNAQAGGGSISIKQAADAYDEAVVDAGHALVEISDELRTKKPDGGRITEMFKKVGTGIVPAVVVAGAKAALAAAGIHLP